MAIVVAGCDDPNLTEAPYYEYTVTVTGLDNFTTDSGSAVIMVPVPEINGTVVLPFTGKLNGSLNTYANGSAWDYDNVNINQWGYNGTRNISANDTDHGSMIEAGFIETPSYQVDKGQLDAEAHSGNTTPIPVTEKSNRSGSAVSLTPDAYGMVTITKARPTFDNVGLDIREVLGPWDDATNASVSSLRNQPLYPIGENGTANYTVQTDPEALTSYTSWIYVDPELKPVTPGGNHTIVVDAKFEVVTGYHPYGSVYGDHYTFVIREEIPEGVTGYVPVTVQYIGDMTEYQAT